MLPLWGAGISGLAAAYALGRAGRSVHVFESASQVAGRMATHRWNGYVIDTGAEMLATYGYPATWRLIRATGLSTVDIPRIRAGIAIWRNSRAHAGAGSPTALLTGAGLSWPGRLALLRFAAATAVRRRGFDLDRPEDSPLGAQTVADLAIRYAARNSVTTSSSRSSAACTAGSRTARRQRLSWPPWQRYAAPRPGEPTATGWTPSRCAWPHGYRSAPAVPVREVVSGPDSARLVIDGETLTARRVLLCVPAPVAVALHANAPEDERPYLSANGYAPMLRVSCPLDKPLAVATRRPVHILAVPLVENGILAGLTIDQLRHPGRVPDGRGLVTVLAAPPTTADLIGAPDDTVARCLLSEAEDYLPGLGAATLTTLVHPLPVRPARGEPSRPSPARRLPPPSRPSRRVRRGLAGAPAQQRGRGPLSGAGDCATAVGLSACRQQFARLTATWPQDHDPPAHPQVRLRDLPGDGDLQERHRRGAGCPGGPTGLAPPLITIRRQIPQRR